MRLTDEELGKILEQRKRRDHEAYMIGVATAEWRRLVRLAEDRIEKSEAVERADGEQILRNHHLDPTTHEYRIEPDGRIVELGQGPGRQGSPGQREVILSPQATSDRRSLTPWLRRSHQNAPARFYRMPPWWLAPAATLFGPLLSAGSARM